MKKLTLFLAALLTCSMSFAASVVKTTSIPFGTATGGCNFNSASVTYTDANNMVWTMQAVGATKFTQGTSYSQVSTNSSGSSFTLTGTAATAMNLTAVSIRLNAGYAKVLNPVTITVNGETYATGKLNGTNDVTISGNTAKTIAQGQSIVISISDLATANMRFYEISYSYEVDENPATGLSLNKTTTSLEQYKRDTLKATLTPADANTNVVWTSSNATVATVTDGVVYAIGIGTATITATAGSVSATCDVTVAATTPLTVAQARKISLALQNSGDIAAGGKYVVRGYMRGSLSGYYDSKVGQLYYFRITDSKDGKIINHFSGYAKLIDKYHYLGEGAYVEIVGDITKSAYSGSKDTCQMKKNDSDPVTIRVLSMGGYYTVGTTEECDYTSLYDAFEAYNTNALKGMVAHDVTFGVASDLTEPKNVGLQNPTDHTVTLTVDGTEERTITFTQTTANAGPSGNICIGCDNTLSYASTDTASMNIVIDGGYDEYDDYDEEIIGHVQQLTIQSAADSYKANGPISVCGNVKDVTIMNCKSIHAANGIGYSDMAAVSVICPTKNYAPSNVIIRNNNISNVSNGRGIRVGKGLSLGSVTARPAKVSILENVITSSCYGLYFDGIQDTITIKGNTIKVAQNQDVEIAAIYSNKTSAGKVFVIENNTISQLRSADDIYGIRFLSGKMYIRNNYISGFDIATTPADSTVLKGISIESTDSVYIEHNTLALADLENTIKNKLANVCLLYATNKCRIRNNLFYSAETDFRNALVNNTGVFSNNVYCTSSYVSTRFKDLLLHKSQTESTAKGVTSVSFVDLANGNLDLTGDSKDDKNLSVPALATVPTDIHGTAREAETYAGAFQGKSIVYVPQYNIVATCDPTLGTVTGGGLYNENDTATLTPIANEHYHFTQWSDGNTDNPRKVIVTGEATYRAQFAIDTFTVTITCDAEQGSVTGGGTYTYGEQATIKAVANEGYHFTQWSDGNTYITRTIIVTGDVSYSAQFTINSYTITVTCDETQGTVAGSGTYSRGTQATLTATANEGYHFTQWSDGNTETPRTVTVTGDATYTAQFAIDTFTVTITCDAEQGSVTGGGTYTYGEQATIKAVANEGYTFSQWSDGSEKNPRTITVVEDITLEALYVVADAVDNINSDAQPTTQKIIRNGQVYILRGNKTYTTLGQERK